jgi:protein required for attachment to host cells
VDESKIEGGYMSKPWILVANQSEARIYTAETPRGALIEIDRLEHEVGHSREGDLKSDRPGRSFERMGTIRHAMETEVDPKEQEAMRFAKQISDYLESGQQRGRFDGLVLVAGPHFLGLLRKALGPVTAKLVTQEIAKNLVQYDAEAIRGHLPERL